MLYETAAVFWEYETQVWLHLHRVRFTVYYYVVDKIQFCAAPLQR